MTIQQLLEDESFWKMQTNEFEAMMLDYVQKEHRDALNMHARLYVGHMRSIISRKAEKNVFYTGVEQQ